MFGKNKKKTQPLRSPVRLKHRWQAASVDITKIIYSISFKSIKIDVWPTLTSVLGKSNFTLQTVVNDVSCNIFVRFYHFFFKIWRKYVFNRIALKRRQVTRLHHFRTQCKSVSAHFDKHAKQ